MLIMQSAKKREGKIEMFIERKKKWYIMIMGRRFDVAEG